MYNECESNACLRVLCPGCPLALSQPAGESRRFVTEGMGRPPSNLRLNLHTASSEWLRAQNTSIL